MVDIYLNNTPSLSRTALQEISPNKSIRKSFGIKSPGKISKYPSGSGSPLSISAYQNVSKRGSGASGMASLPWSRRSQSITNSFTVFPDVEVDSSGNNSINSSMNRNINHNINRSINDTVNEAINSFNNKSRNGSSSLSTVMTNTATMEPISHSFNTSNHPSGTPSTPTGNSTSTKSYTNAIQALRALSSSPTDEDEPITDTPNNNPHTQTNTYSLTCRTHAGKLRSRLRLAYYKVLTNQTALSINQMTLPETKSFNTPKRRQIISNNTTTPITDRYTNNGTPSSMKAAKSLLSLGTF